MADIVWNDHALEVLFVSPRGPVGRDLSRRAIRVHAHAVSICAVDTGNLRSSITWELTEGHGGHAGLTAVVGTNVEYAPYVEFGTSTMSAQPFLRPSLRYAR
jgi:HK97 gp10 family phage protein